MDTSTRPDPVCGSRGLEAFFEPHGIVVVGGTERVGTVGRALLENLAEFPGLVCVVHPHARQVLGRDAVPRFSEVPDGIDLAVIATPAPSVPGLVAEAGARGIRAAIVISAGFKESGARGRELEQATVEAARVAGVRLIGPNCLGVMSPGRGLNATFAAGMARAGSVAFLSQSGALCTGLLDWSLRENVGFSAFVSVGSMADVAWGELLTHFRDDPGTKSIVCYLESVGDARAFVEAARSVTAVKPVIALKVGRTAAAAKAAASHTGALTGSDAVLDAAFQRAGVVRVETIGELFNVAEALAKQPLPRGRRLCILTNAGGPGALSTDLLIRSGGELAELGENTVATLNGFLPSPWSHGNPVDILGDADAERYARAAGLLLADPGNDGLLVVLTPQHMTDPAAVARRVADAARGASKPLLTSWLGGRAVSEGREILNAAGIPTFDYPDSAARAFVRMAQAGVFIGGRDVGGGEAAHVAGDLPGVEGAGQAILDEVLAKGRTLLTESESKRFLSACGIPMNRSIEARDEAEAVAAAATFGGAVAVKLLSDSITHKSDVGGVRLGVVGAEAVRSAWRGIRQAVESRCGPGHFDGVTVQAMVPADGQELILGVSTDPQFGPVMMFGAGGRWVEVFRDTALELPPVDRAQARAWRERTRINRALQGLRGEPAVDLEALDALLVRFSRIVLRHPRIAEIDINPLRASAGAITGLDARVVLHPASITDAALPRSAVPA